MFMLTSLGRIVGLFALCFFLIGYVHGQTLMFMIALFCVAVLLGAALFSWLSLRGLKCQRELHSATVYSGDPMEGHIRVTEGVGRWRLLEIFDEHTNLITGHTTRRRMTLMTEGGKSTSAVVAGTRQSVQALEGARRSVEVRDVLRFTRRGHYRLGPITLHAHDPFGLLYRSAAIASEQQVIVYPRPLPMSELVVGGAGGRQHAEVRAHGRAGETAEFHGIRPYVHGDDLRRVHWKATAHTGKLAIKEFEYRSSGALQVILDLQADVHSGEKEYSTLETAVTLAASVANYAIGTGNQAGFLATGSTLANLPQESGQRQLHRVLETLALAKADGEISLAQALAANESHLTRRSTAIVITPTVDMAIIGPLLALRGRSAQVVLVLIDPHSFYQAEQDARKPHNPLMALATTPIDLKKSLAAITTPRRAIPTTEQHRRVWQGAAAAGIEVIPITADVSLHQIVQGIRMHL